MYGVLCNFVRELISWDVKSVHKMKNEGGLCQKRSWLSTVIVGFLTLTIFSCSESNHREKIVPRDGSNLSLNLMESASIELISEDLFVPWGIDFSPDGRVFFTERPGRIRIIQNGHLLSKPWLTLRVSQTSDPSGGLFGLALHPLFTENHFAYVAYTQKLPNGKVMNRLARLREQPDGTGIFDSVLLEHSLPNGESHYGGCVKFGPDGKLYWTTGDLGHPDVSQDLSHLAGKILRLNPDGTIPDDNPFPGSPIYSYGHRNPQGLAWQPRTEHLYSIEHGPAYRDELNYIQAGENYGWPEIVGDNSLSEMRTPALHSGDNETWAPAGAIIVTQGYLRDSMLFTGLKGMTLYRAILSPTVPGKVIDLKRLLVNKYGRLRALAEGPDGSIYLGTSNGDGIGSEEPGREKLFRISFP